jgi:Leucine-rich repeat (LRR) protein
MGSGISSEWSVRKRILQQAQEQNPLLRVSVAAMGIKVIPVIGKFCPLVTYLNLSNNIITALPDHLKRLPHLTALDVSTNNIASLPEFLSALAHLQDLRASDNNIFRLPESLILPSLTSLSLCRNYLEEGLPPALCYSCHSTLRVLRLSNNGLGCARASETVSLLTSLVELDLGINNLGGDGL